MPLATSRPPKGSLDKLKAALESLSLLKERNQRWMKLHPPSASHLRGSYAHPLYTVRVSVLVEGQSLGRSLVRVAWVYLVHDKKGALAAAEVSIVEGKHSGARLMEGPFVGKLRRAIDKVMADQRLKGRYELRSIRIESLHLFMLWLRKKGAADIFVPLNSLGDRLKAGRRYTERDLVTVLAAEAKRVQEAHQRIYSQ